MGYSLILGNCYDELKKMKDNSVDCVITSPPYNMNLRIRSGKYCSRQIVKEFSTKYDDFSDNMPMEEYYEFHKNVITELLRITKGYIFYIVQPVTGNKPALYKILGDFHKNIKDVIIWNKVTGQPAMANLVMNSVFEYIIIFTKDQTSAMSRQFVDASFARGTLNNVWNIKRRKSVDKSHAATFPEDISDNIIVNFTKENDVILDPFSGTGTTGVSCLKNKRNYIGIEISEKYLNISKERLDSI